MPFTGSHPAAILPLLGTGLPASALVIGSMAPDLPYFAPVPVSPGLTHSPVGVVGIDVLIGAVFFILWHAVLAAPAVAVAPMGLRARVPASSVGALRRRVSTPRRAALVAAALAVGAATHVTWDEFT